MTLSIFLMIANTHVALAILAAGLSLVRFRLRQPYIRLLGLAMILSAAGDLSSYVLRAFSVNPNYGQTTYHIAILPVISLLYFHAIEKKHGGVFLFVAIVYALFGIFNVLWIQQATINTYTLILKAIIMILYALYYFYWLMQTLPSTKLHRLPMFWINTAWILFFSGVLILYVFTSYLVNALNNNLLVYWSLHNGLAIIEALIIIGALWMDLRNTK